ncbi:DUF4129 domain-containing protein [Thermus sp.]
MRHSLAGFLVGWALLLLALGTEPPALLGPPLLLLGRRFFPEGFLWLAFLPGFLHAPEAGWPLLWAKTSWALLLFGLYLSREKGLWAALWLLPLALSLGPWGLGLWGLLHGFHLLARAEGVALGPFLPLLLAALGFGLGHLSLPSLPEPPPPAPAPLLFRAGPGEDGGPGGSVVYLPPEGGFPLWVGVVDRLLAYALPLALVLLLALGLLLLGQRRGLPLFRGLHLLPLLLALPLLLGLFFLLGSLGGGEGAGGQGVSHPPPSPPSQGPVERVPGPRALGEVGVALAGLSALFTLALLLALLAWAWRGQGGEEEGGEEAASASPRASQRSFPASRVRRAYLEALEALKAAGLPRRLAEGPVEYEKRVGAALPEAHPPLARLTALYLPVRYGGRAEAEEADEAEVLALRILELCSTKRSKAP